MLHTQRGEKKISHCNHLKIQFQGIREKYSSHFQAPSARMESVWWSHLMKIQIVFMDHILFRFSFSFLHCIKGGNWCWQVRPGGEFFQLPFSDNKNCVLRYLELFEFNLSSNCFMKLRFVFMRQFLFSFFPQVKFDELRKNLSKRNQRESFWCWKRDFGLNPYRWESKHEKLLR